MSLRDLHIHTTFSDGKNSPEEIVLAALAKGIDTIGFSDHSYTSFDESYCIKKENVDKYISEIIFLKKKYGDKIKILLGIEQDFYSDFPTEDFDYVIGSVHYLKIGNNYIQVDESANILKSAANKYFGGDMYSLIEEYYRTVTLLVKNTSADIIGHFDLITKFNENRELFDEDNERYISAALNAADTLLREDRIFEINTGAISRGYKSKPYPSGFLIDYIKSHQGRFILSSDSHRADTLCYGFEVYKQLI